MEINAFNARMGSQEQAVWIDGYWRTNIDSRLPQTVRAANLSWVAHTLEQADIEYVWVRTRSPSRNTIAIAEGDRESVLHAFAQAAHATPLYVQPVAQRINRRRRPIPLAAAAFDTRIRSAPAIRVAQFYHGPNHFRYGLGYSCDIEFWDREAEYVRTPRTNTVSDKLSAALLDERRRIGVDSRDLPTLALFTMPGLDEVTFPIDAVYTWVDGSDPVWLNRMQEQRAAALGVPFHPLAQHQSRFHSREELRYSLRSLEMYAPWIRHVYLITDQQRPHWLAESPERFTLLDHRDIFEDPSVLPVFNSNAIISQLYRIDGLSEHFLYINDDFFFGRPVSPSLFYTGSGLARVFPSRNLRPVGVAHSNEEPHINLTNNIRSMIAAQFGRSIAHAIKHTPYPQLKSVHAEMAQIYSSEYQRTSASRFRHHEDFAADQLFHYYAQAAGKAVPGPIRYHYVNIQDDLYLRVLNDLLTRRDRDVFCLNDAPGQDLTPIPDSTIAEFLESYFPIPSRFEIAPDTLGSSV